jgi:MFS family permease
MNRIARTYYVIYGVYNLSWAFIAPMYVLFLLSRGLDLFQASIVPAVFFIVSVFFEVPTGAFADLAGRKQAFLLSCLLRMVAFGMYAFSHRFASFIAAEFVDALGATLANGALDAWAVDSLHEEGEARPTARFFARAHIVGRTAIMVSGLAGGYLAQRDMTLPWLTAAGSFALTGILATTLMVETRRAPGSSVLSRRSLVRTVREGVIAVHDLPVLRLLCLLTLGLAFASLPAQHISWPRLQSLSGQGLWVMGWIWALMNLASLIGSAMLPRLLGRRGRSVVLSVITLWRGLMLAMAAVATTLLPTLAGLLLMEVGFGLSEPLLQAWLNEHIASERRATVLSVRAMCMTLGQGTGLLCLGRVARDATIPTAWMTSALILLLIAPVFLLLARRAEVTAGLNRNASIGSRQIHGGRGTAA